ncbi:MAG: YqcC family protein [Chloroflexota bacterium]
MAYQKPDDAFYQHVAAQIAAIEAEMKRVGLWQDTPLQPEQYDFRAAFAGDTMAFPQWLQFIFIPNVLHIIDAKGVFPSNSQVAGYAVREFDTYREDTSQLIPLLSDFDRLFTG